jgi:hypothetical protein
LGAPKAVIVFSEGERKKTYSRKTLIQKKIRKQKMKKRMERKKNSIRQNGNRPHRSTLTSRNGKISGATAPPSFPCAVGAKGFSRADKAAHGKKV